MGTWGAEAFQNDDALALANDLAASRGDALLEDALAAAADCEGYLEAPECQRAIAAAEVVAGLLGSPLPALPENVTAWIRSQQAPRRELVRLATRALLRIRSDSELKELWDDDPEEWQAVLANIERRLG